mmetsp:Transcript_10340/g.20216  ORF Transcript_10340/g.20216 Transcript_10340/m.20216 type:complete len:85 (+) Transcript_10340:55-309(+)
MDRWMKTTMPSAVVLEEHKTTKKNKITKVITKSHHASHHTLVINITPKDPCRKHTTRDEDQRSRERHKPVVGRACAVGSPSGTK